MSEDLQRRVAALEEQVQLMNGRAAIAMGEAMIGCFMVPIFFELLQKNGLVSNKEVEGIYDFFQLTLENNRATHPASISQAAIDHACSRLEGMLKSKRQQS